MFYYPLIKFLHGAKRVNGVDRYGKKQFIHRGGGFKFLSLFLDYERGFTGVPGLVVNLFFYKKKQRVVACVAYANGFVSYIVSWHGNCIGNWVFSGINVPLYPGNRSILRDVSKGSSFFHLSNDQQGKALYIRSKGCVGIVLKKILNYCLVKMPSGEERAFHESTWVTLGRLSWLLFHTRRLYKAGNARKYGRRPVVRGVAKNPVDHPHGGGEGRTSGGRPSSTPWGVYTKGVKTRKRKNSLIMQRKVVNNVILFT